MKLTFSRRLLLGPGVFSLGAALLLLGSLFSAPIVNASTSQNPAPPPNSYYGASNCGSSTLPCDFSAALRTNSYSGEYTPYWTGNTHVYYAPTTNTQVNPEGGTMFGTSGTSCPDNFYAYIRGDFGGGYVSQLYYLGSVAAGAPGTSWHFSQTGPANSGMGSDNPYGAPSNLGGYVNGHVTVWVGFENPDVAANGFNTNCSALSPIWLDQYPAGTYSSGIGTGSSACNYDFINGQATNYNCGAAVMDLYTDNAPPNLPSINLGSINGGTVTWNITDNGDQSNGSGTDAYASGTKYYNYSAWWDNNNTLETSGACGPTGPENQGILTKGTSVPASQSYNQCNDISNTSTAWTNVNNGDNQGYVAHFCVQAVDWLGNASGWACNYAATPIGYISLVTLPSSTTASYPSVLVAIPNPSYNGGGDSIIFADGVSSPNLATPTYTEPSSQCGNTTPSGDPISISPGQTIEFTGAGSLTACSVNTSVSTPQNQTITAYLIHTNYPGDPNANASRGLSWSSWGPNLSANPTSLPTTYSSVLDIAPTNAPPAYSNSALSDNPSAYWPLNDTSSVIADVSGNGHNGTAGSGVSTNSLPGPSGQPATSFAGTGDISVPSIPTTSTSTWSIFATIQAGQLPTSGNPQVLAYNGGYGSNGYGLGIGAGTSGASGPGSDLEAIFGGYGWLDSGYTLPAYCLESGSNTAPWCAVGVVDNNATITFYLDGNIVSQISSPWTANTPSGGDSIGGVGGDYYTGGMSSVGLFSSALTTTQAVALQVQVPPENLVVYDSTSGIQSVNTYSANSCGSGTVSGDPITLTPGTEDVFTNAGYLTNCYLNVLSNSPGTYQFTAFAENPISGAISPTSTTAITWEGWQTILTGDGHALVDPRITGETALLSATSNFGLSQQGTSQTLSIFAATVSNGVYSPTGSALVSCTTGTTCPATGNYTFPEPASTATNCISASYIDACFIAEITSGSTVLAQSNLEVEWDAQLPTPPGFQASTAPTVGLTGTTQYFWADQPYLGTQTLSQDGQSYTFTPTSITWTFGDGNTKTETLPTGWGTPPNANGTPTSNITNVYQQATGSGTTNSSACGASWTQNEPYNWCAVLTWNWSTTVNGQVQSGQAYSSTPTYSLQVNQLQSTYQLPNQCTLTASPASGSAGIGQAVSLSASCPPAVASYQFLVQSTTASSPTVVQAWSSATTATWNTSNELPGDYYLILQTSDATSGQCSSTDSTCANTSIFYALDGCSTPVLTLTPSSPQAVGVTISMSASSTCVAGSTPEYQFTYLPAGSSGTPTVLQNYSTSSSYNWDTGTNPSGGVAAGTYNITVNVKPSTNANLAAASTTLSYVLSSPCTSASLQVEQLDSNTVITSTASGTTVNVVGSATCPAGDNPTFSFYYTPPGGSGLTPIPNSGWSAASSTDWATPSSPPGLYTITMEVSSLGNNVPDSGPLGEVTTTLNLVAWSLTLSQSASPINVGSTDTVTSTSNGSISNTGYTEQVISTQTAFAQTLLSYGAQSYWPLNDTGTSTALDNSGNNNNASLTNVTEGATASPLSLSGQLTDYFNGSASGVGPNVFDNPTNFSEVAWFKTTATDSGIMGFVNNPSSPGGWDRNLYVNSAGYLQWGVCGSICPDTITSPSPVNNGAWHFAVAEQTPSGLQLYLDGVLVATDTTGTSAQNMSGQFVFGEVYGSFWPNLASSWNYFNGDLSNLAVLPENLTASQVAALYNDAGQPNKSVSLATCSTGTTCVGTTSPTVPGAYSLLSQLNTNPTTYSNSLSLMVLAGCVSPNLSASPSGATMAGNSVTLSASSTCTVGATPTYEFIWINPDNHTSGTIQSFSTSSTATWNTSPTMAENYQLEVIVEAEWQTAPQGTATINYTLTPAPQPCSGVDLVAANYSPPNGQSLPFSASATCPNYGGAPTVYYQWIVGSAPNVSSPVIKQSWTAGASQYTLSGLSAGSYDMEVQVTNNQSQGVQATAYVAFNISSPAPSQGCTGISGGPAPQTAQVGTTVTLSSASPCASYSYANDVFADAASAYWPLNDTSSTVVDATGHGNNGTLSGSVTENVTPGPIQSTPSTGGMYFNGSDYVSIPSTPINPQTSAWSVSAWIKPAVLPNSTSGLVYYDAGTGANGFGFGVGAGTGGGGSELTVLLGAVAWIPDGVNLPSSCTSSWCFVAVEYTTNNYIFYVNGQQVASVTSSSKALPPSAGATIGLGNGVNGFVGDIADVAVSGYDISGLSTYSSQISQLYLDATSVVAPTYEWTWTPPPESTASGGSIVSGSPTYQLNTSSLSPGTWTIHSYVTTNGNWITLGTYYLQLTAGTNAAGSCSGLSVGGGETNIYPSLNPSPFTASFSSCAAGTTPFYAFSLTEPGGTTYQEQAPAQDSTWQWITQSLPYGTYTITVTGYSSTSATPLATATTQITLSPTLPCTSLTVTDSSNVVNTPFAPTTDTITANANCGGGTPYYQFYYAAPGTSVNWQLGSSFSTSNTFTWNGSGAAAGTWSFLVWVSDYGYTWPPQNSQIITVYSGPNNAWPPAVSSPTAYCQGGQVGASPDVAQVGTVVSLLAHQQCPFPGFYGPNFSNDLAQLGSTPDYPLSTINPLSSSYYNSTMNNFGIPNDYWPLTSVSSMPASSYDNYPLSNGALGDWPLNDTGGGTTAHDLSTYTNSGSLVNGVTETTATSPLVNDHQSVFYFNGSNQYVSIPNISAYDIGNSVFTISAWIDPTSTSPSYQMIMTKDVSNGASNAQFELRLNTNTVQVVAPGGGIADSWTGVPAGAWTQITMVYGGGYTLYINGNLVAGPNGQTIEDSNSEPIYIGAREDSVQSGAGMFFGGYIANISYSNQAWSSSQVAQAYIDSQALQSTPNVSNGGDTGYVMGSSTSLGSGSPVASDSVPILNFNGSNQYIATPEASTFTTNFTESVWFVTTSSNIGLMSFQSNPTGTGSPDHDRALWIGSNGELYGNAYNSGLYEVNSSTAVNNGSWHLATLTLSGAGLQLYLDGNLVSTNTGITSVASYPGFWEIGMASEPGWSNAPASPYFSGYLFGAATFAAALSAQQINLLYTAAIVSLTTPDTSGSGNTGLLVGGGITTYAPSYETGPVIDNNVPVININSSSPSYISTTNYMTIPTAYSEIIWFKTYSPNSGLISFQSNQSGTEPGGWNGQLYIGSNGDLYYGAAGSTFTTVNTPSPVDNGQWHMAVATQSASGYALYLDGNLVGSNSSVPASQTGWWRIGEVNGNSWPGTNGSMDWINGSIADAAIVPTNLTASQVNALYVDATTFPPAVSYEWTAISPGGGSISLGSSQPGNFSWNTTGLAPGDWLVGYRETYENTGSNAFTSVVLQSAAPAATTCSSVSLGNTYGGAVNYPSTTTFTANASCSGPGYPQYQFSITPSGGGSAEIVQPYSPTNTWTWNDAIYALGTYTVTVTVEADTASSAQATASNTITAAWNPVGIYQSCGSYSGDPCAAGAQVTIIFSVPTLQASNLSIGAYDSANNMLAFCSANNSGNNGQIACNNSAIFASNTGTPYSSFTLYYTPASGVTSQNLTFKLYSNINLTGSLLSQFTLAEYWA